MLQKHAHGPTTAVTFRIPALLKAKRMTLVGEFNNWSETATPLDPSDDGWSITLELPQGHEYEYRYLADGANWLNDWDADRYVPNELGGANSVVRT